MNRAGVPLAERDAFYNGYICGHNAARAGNVRIGPDGAARESYTKPEEIAAWDRGREQGFNE